MKTAGYQISIVDDDPDLQIFLQTLFQAEGHFVTSYHSGEEFMSSLSNTPSGVATQDLVICDLCLPDRDGIEVIEWVHQKAPGVPTILITAHGSIDIAVKALKCGVFDYITKPINPVEMSVLTARAIKMSRLEEKCETLKKQLEQGHKKGALLGKSQPMKTVFDLIDRVAKTASNILITGESGTGKEGIARAIHSNSPRARAPFVAINCAAIPENLLESELFGHKRGAFTGASDHRIGLLEEAHGGTLFLDEIGDMPMSLQSKLLRVLQEKKIKPVGANDYKNVDLRLIAATHKDLRKGIEEGSFREDLFYRLCVIPIHAPPLRDRIEDIPMLAEHFVRNSCEKSQLPLKTLTKGAMAKLMRMSWPGNVRELENVIERAVVMSDHERIGEAEIQSASGESQDASIKGLFEKFPNLEQLEKAYIAYVLEETENHKEKAAEILGINRKTLYRKERDLGGGQTQEVGPHL